MAEHTRGTSIWRRLALPASLTLNLFLIALIGGHLVYTHRAERVMTTPLARVWANAQASLAPRDAAAFGEVIQRNAPRYAEETRRIGEARRELERQITADPIDPAAAKQAFSAWEITWNQFLDDFGGTLIDALVQVSPEGRRKLIAAHPFSRGGPATPEATK